MKKSLKILFCVISTIIVVLSILCLILNFSVLKQKFNIYDIFGSAFVDTSVIPKMRAVDYIIFSVCFVNIIGYIVLSAVIINNNKNAIKYTYEEYKAIMDKKKAEKQAEDKQKKIENLKQQLSDLENTD